MTTRRPIDDAELAEVRLRCADDPRDLLAWTVGRFAPERRVVVTGLQEEGVVVADLAMQIDPSVRVLTIDTGRLPAATHAYLDELRAHWGRDIEVIRPNHLAVQSFSRDHGINPFYTSTDLRLACCHVRKVAPLGRALADVDCWMTGLRRDQSDERAATPTVERDLRHGGIVKLNPLAHWSDVELSEYVQLRGLPSHPLYADGYRSIGCEPCTRPVRDDEGRRAGRWWWEDGAEKECGIHAAPSPADEVLSPFR